MDRAGASPFFDEPIDALDRTDGAALQPANRHDALTVRVVVQPVARLALQRTGGLVVVERDRRRTH